MPNMYSHDWPTDTDPVFQNLIERAAEEDARAWAAWERSSANREDGRGSLADADRDTFEAGNTRARVLVEEAYQDAGPLQSDPYGYDTEINARRDLIRADTIAARGDFIGPLEQEEADYHRELVEEDLERRWMENQARSERGDEQAADGPNPDGTWTGLDGRTYIAEGVGWRDPLADDVQLELDNETPEVFEHTYGIPEPDLDYRWWDEYEASLPDHVPEAEADERKL